MGILTLNQVDNCMNVTTNRILCGVELSVGLIVVFLLVREIRRVPVLLRVMLSLHSIQTTFVIGVCAVALAEADPTIEASYALYSTAHVFFAFAISCRLYVLTRVVYMSASSPQRARARAHHTWKIAAVLFGLAGMISIINVSLWMFTSLYAKPGSAAYEYYHQMGFVAFGSYLICFATGLACVSRYVIKLYVGDKGRCRLQADSDSSDGQKRKKGSVILWSQTLLKCIDDFCRQMTISTITSMYLGAILRLAIVELVLGAIPGALRNEIRSYHQESERLELEKQNTRTARSTRSQGSELARSKSEAAPGSRSEAQDASLDHASPATSSSSSSASSPASADATANADGPNQEQPMWRVQISPPSARPSAAD